MAFCYGSSKLSEDEKAAKIASVHIMMMDSDFSSANKRDLNDKIVASLFGTFLPLLHCSSLFFVSSATEKNLNFMQIEDEKISPFRIMIPLHGHIKQH
jgi:hypothetical protein